MKWHQSILRIIIIIILLSCTTIATLNGSEFLIQGSGKVTSINYSTKQIWLDYKPYKIDDKANIYSNVDYKNISLYSIIIGDEVTIRSYLRNKEQIIIGLTKISNIQDSTKKSETNYSNFLRHDVGSVTEFPIEHEVKKRESVAAPPQLVITGISLYEPSNNGILDSEEIGKIRITVKNNGKGSAFDVNIVIQDLDDKKYSTGITFNERSVIGSIDPGEQKDVEVTIEADKDTKTANIRLQVTAVESNGFDSQPIILSFKTKEFIPPILQIAKVDIQDADGNRRVTKGKEINITLTVQNAGIGRAKGVLVTIESGDTNVKIFGETTVSLATLSPGESKKASFSIAVTQRYHGSKTLPVSFAVREERDRFSIMPDIKLALGEDAPEIRVVKVEVKDANPVKINVAEGIETLPVIPISQQIFNKNDIAVVIGIERYQNLPKSDFSYNDAKIVRGYLKALGFADRNIEFVTDEKATRSGIEKTVEKWLPNRTMKASKVLVYYSGHGSPDPETGEPYIVPTDGDPNYLSSTGYPLKRLYGELAKLKVEEITVILDSCFSGSGGRSVLAKGARPLVISSENIILSSNLAVITATQGSQISTSSLEKEHGIFTYYFFKAIKDGKKNLAEIYEYIKPLVEDDAKRLNVQQSPSVSPDVQKIRGRFGLRK